VTVIEAPKPMISTTTMSSPILIASRERTIGERLSAAARRNASRRDAWPILPRRMCRPALAAFPHCPVC
jgi:hypothetical protein